MKSHSELWKLLVITVSSDMIIIQRLFKNIVHYLFSFPSLICTFLRDDREGRFLLRRIDEHSNMPQVTGLKFEIWFCLNIVLICVWNASVFCVVCLYLSCQWNIFFQPTQEDSSFKRKLSKREKKELKKQEKKEKVGLIYVKTTLNFYITCCE